MRSPIFLYLSALLSLMALGCGDEDGNEADRLGVGAACDQNADCPLGDTSEDPDQVCLPFKGGYCGLSDCTADADCPSGSACVAHDDGRNYCFRLCVDKAECNLYRGVDEEANCSSNITFVDGKQSAKACVPPSSS